MDKAKKNTVIHAAADRMAANYKSSQIPMYGDALRMPNRNAVIEIIRDCQKLIFPVYYGDRDLLKLPPEQYSALLMEHIHEKLTRQITLTMPECDENCEVAYAISTAFIERIPAIQELLLKDLSANFEGDPAAYSKEEVLLSYPGMFARQRRGVERGRALDDLAVDRNFLTRLDGDDRADGHVVGVFDVVVFGEEPDNEDQAPELDETLAGMDYIP